MIQGFGGRREGGGEEEFLYFFRSCMFTSNLNPLDADDFHKNCTLASFF